MDRDWLENRADRIERFCEGRRIFVRVQGGVVTAGLVRFHLFLDPAVPLKRLEHLSDDLALELGVDRCRVSRRDGTISLEVPRPRPAALSLVRLQAEMPPLPPYAALLGRDEEGSPLLLRLSSPEVGHLLIVGTAGSGKTALLRTILSSLALSNDPLDLRFLLVEPKRNGLECFQGLPHLAAPVLREGEEVERRLSWLLEEMLWREETGVREPRVVAAVDDAADLLLERPSLREVLTGLAARGPEVGIHSVLCSRRKLPWFQGGFIRAVGPGDFILMTGKGTVRFQAAQIAGWETREMVALLVEDIRR